MRSGLDHRYPKHVDSETGKKTETHLYMDVHREMLLQVCRDYAGIPDVRTLTCSQIRFFYEPMRAELKAATKPVEKKR